MFFLFLYFSFVTTLLPLPPLLPIKILPQKKGLSFELWLRDSQSNFHQKIAMLYILICIFFMLFSFLYFSFVTKLLLLPRLHPIKIPPQKKGPSFELRLSDSQSNFHQKIAML